MLKLTYLLPLEGTKNEFSKIFRQSEAGDNGKTGEADLKGDNTAAPRQRHVGRNAGGFTADESNGGRGLTVGGGRAAGGNTTARSAQSSHREDERCWLKP